jgi:uncharacterized protein
VKPSLLDVSVLVALFWTSHPRHETAREWFARHANAGWATCPVTQAGFVRVVSNPKFSKSSPTVAEAAKLLGENLGHPMHRYWPADINFLEATESFLPRIIGYRQSTEAYLLGLAMHRRGRLVTMDRGISQLIPDSPTHRDLVTLI